MNLSTPTDSPFRAVRQAFHKRLPSLWVAMLLVVIGTALHFAAMEIMDRGLAYVPSDTDPSIVMADAGTMWMSLVALLLVGALTCIVASLGVVVFAPIQPRQSVRSDGQLDDEAVDRFAAVMKAKLSEARGLGRGGWQEPGLQQRLSDLLREHVDKGDPRDVANFAMFLQQRGESILPASDQPDRSG